MYGQGFERCQLGRSYGKGATHPSIQLAEGQSYHLPCPCTAAYAT